MLQVTEVLNKPSRLYWKSSLCNKQKLLLVGSFEKLLGVKHALEAGKKTVYTSQEISDLSNKVTLYQLFIGDYIVLQDINPKKFEQSKKTLLKKLQSVGF